MKLLTLAESNPKFAKSLRRGYYTAGLMLAPHRTSGINVCPDSTPECRKHCLAFAGRGKMFRSVRVQRTRWWHEDPESFLRALDDELETLIRKARQMGMKPACRLNVLSDIPWEEETNVFDNFPEIQFYDYTKSVKRACRSMDGGYPWPGNYHLTLSHSEINSDDCRMFLKNGGTVAWIIEDLDTWLESCRFPLVDGEEHDLTFLHPSGTIIALSPKGSLVKASSPFKS